MVLVSTLRKRSLVLSVCLLGLVASLTGASLCAASEAHDVVLCQGNYQTEEQAKEQLAKFAATYSNCSQWEK